MGFTYFLQNVIPIQLTELVAAIAGTYYLGKIPPLRSTKYLVYFLWLTIIVELICSYPAIAYFSEYKYFGFVEDTPYEDNYWIYNVYIIISYLFYIYYFRSFLKNKVLKSFLLYTMILYAIVAVVYLFVSDIYFNGISSVASIAGTLILTFVIIAFYFELLKSDVLLKLKHFLPLYISVGVLVFHLCLTPIDIFSEYYDDKNTFYNELKANVYLYSNIFLYSTFTIGFLICSRRKTSY